MSTPIQWLLIGGSYHGKTVWLRSGWRIRMPDGTVYAGMNFLSNRRLYRIGYVGPAEPNNFVVYEMIEQVKPVHIAGS